MVGPSFSALSSPLPGQSAMSADFQLVCVLERRRQQRCAHVRWGSSGQSCRAALQHKLCSIVPRLVDDPLQQLSFKHPTLTVSGSPRFLCPGCTRDCWISLRFVAGISDQLGGTIAVGNEWQKQNIIVTSVGAHAQTTGCSHRKRCSLQESC